MDFIEAIILGIIQGLTEFLPISSSGHLEIANKLLNNKIGSENLLLIIVLHFGTAVSTLIVFKQDIMNIIHEFVNVKRNEKSSSFVLKIIYSMIPVVIVGLVFEEQIQNLFKGNLILVGFMLIITGLLLFLTDSQKSIKKNVSTKNAIIIGVSQAIAILPGISRSGATISTAVLLGIKKNQAAKFSFLMVVPIIIGKIIKDLATGDISYKEEMFPILIIGFLSSLITGIIACKLMIKIVENSKLKYFSIYCFLIGIICITTQI
ncbi:MAG: UDP-diphosphatase [Flavobacteriales bacterium]|nr:UDP-diphosphatase [Flavobacteriales bacterium]